MLDETGREMHGSWGNMIEAEEAFARMGADVMRWQYCAQPPDRNLLFGFGPAHEIKRKLLTLWNSVTFFVDYANIEGFQPTCGDLERPAASSTPLDRWLVARTHALVARRDGAYEAYSRSTSIRAFEAFVDDLSNWYIRRSRRRFWDGEAALRCTALVRARAGAARDRAGHAVPRRAPLAEPRARRGRDRRVGATSPAGPSRPTPDARCSTEIAEVRRVVELGRQARAASRLKLRQPLRRLVVEGATLAAGARRRDRATSCA